MIGGVILDAYGEIESSMDHAEQRLDLDDERQLLADPRAAVGRERGWYHEDAADGQSLEIAGEPARHDDPLEPRAGIVGHRIEVVRVAAVAAVFDAAEAGPRGLPQTNGERAFRLGANRDQCRADFAPVVDGVGRGDRGVQAKL